MVRLGTLASGGPGGAGRAPRSGASGGAEGEARTSRPFGVVGQRTGGLRRLVRWWSRATAAAHTTAPVAGEGVLCSVAT